MTGLRTSCGLLGPVAECCDDAGTKRSQVRSVTKFRNFSPDGALRAMHVSAVQVAVIVTMYSP